MVYNYSWLKFQLSWILGLTSLSYHFFLPNLLASLSPALSRLSVSLSLPYFLPPSLPVCRPPFFSVSVSPTLFLLSPFLYLPLSLCHMKYSKCISLIVTNLKAVQLDKESQLG